MIQIVWNFQDGLRFYASEKELTQTWVLPEVFCIEKRRKKASKDRSNQGKDKSREHWITRLAVQRLTEVLSHHRQLRSEF